MFRIDTASFLPFTKRFSGKPEHLKVNAKNLYSLKKEVPYNTEPNFEISEWRIWCRIITASCKSSIEMFCL